MKSTTIQIWGVTMKISSFVSKHNLSESTVRYYMDLGLIVPERIKKQYVFNDQCSKTVEIIKKLKDQDFSLEEIRDLLWLQLISGVEDLEYNEYYINQLNRKSNTLIEQKTQLEEKLKRIQEEIERISAKEKPKANVLGVPIDFLRYCACPRCNGPLTIDKGQIERNMIIGGELICDCGFAAQIVNGIILVNKSHEEKNKIDLDRFKEKYIENTDREFIKLIHEAVNWIARTIDFSSLSGKVIMKNNTGIGVCLRNLGHLLPEDSYYIATDNNIEFLKDTKRIMEQKKRKPKLIFICSEFNDIPIADKSVDLIIDKISGSSYDLNKVGFTMNLLKDKPKDGGRWIGTYLYFPTKSVPKSLKKEMIPYFTLDKIKKAFQESYREIDSKDFGSITMELGEYGSFLNKDDEVYQWTYYGEKLKT